MSTREITYTWRVREIMARRGVHTAKGVGDLLAEVQVAVPSHLDDAAREALEKFQALEPTENPRAELMAKARR